MNEAQYHPVAKISDVLSGTSLPLIVAGAAVLICNDGGEIFAIENRCSHLDMAMDGARVRNGFVACPFHGSRFDLENGCPLTAPASEAIKTYPVRVTGEQIEVAI